ncbi:MAG: hypothetical protein WA771_00140 [Chthoniobacterales bacterium]
MIGSPTPPAFDSWQLALPRRVTTLARLEPLHRFEAAKATRSLDLETHDLRTLALMVFDAVIERMGLAAGASREEIVGALRPLILAGEPDANTARVAEVADGVLDFLLNEADRRRAFREEIRVIENGTQTVREVTFHYLQQMHGANDEMVFRATVEGINLYTGTLGLDVEDAQAANAAVLKYQIGRGRFREAVATARQAVATSTEYGMKVRGALETARRDVTQVDWAREILSMLGEARDHLRGRIDADNEISAAVEDHLDDAEPHEREHVAELIGHIRECQARHAELHRLIIEANDAWLGEHSRQAFRPRSISVLPDLEGAVLRQALTLNDARLDAETAWRLTVAFLPASAPAVADGRRLVEMLLAPIRENDSSDSLDLVPDAEEMTQPPDRFSEQDFRDVDDLLSGVPEEGGLLSDLLLSARHGGKTETVQTLLYLLALQDFGEAPETAARAVEIADRGFQLDPFSGDDLRIWPVAEPAEVEL